METVKVSLAIGQVTIAEECVGYAASLSTKKLCYLRYKVYDKSELASLTRLGEEPVLVPSSLLVRASGHPSPQDQQCAEGCGML